MTSIIILNYNTLIYTQTCLASIREHTRDYELIVIDNGSRDGSREWLQQQTDIKLVLNDYNRGFPAGCNQGLAIAEGDELLLLNNDTIATARWLDNLRAALHSDARVGAVSCVTNYCSNFQRIDVDYHDIEAMQEFAARHNAVSDPARWEIRPRLVMFCYLMKREVFARVGMLDERFTPGNFEDDDYSLRIGKAGYSLLLCQDTFIHHHGSASFGNRYLDKESAEFKRADRRYSAILVRNREMLIAKWGIHVLLIQFELCSPELLRRLLEVLPNPPLDPRLAALSRGNNAFAQGRYEAALNEYEQALALDPNDPDALFNMGMLARATGNEDDAARLLARSGISASELLRL